MITDIINKFLFLNHGAGHVSIPGQQVPAGTSPLIAVIVAAVSIAIGIGLWFLLSKKKKI